MTVVNPPRSWPKADKALFAGLPLAVQAVIARREAERDRELRRLQQVVGDQHPITGDDELLRIATTFRQGILGDGDSDCMCFAVSAPLAAFLNSRGAQCEFRVTAMPPPFDTDWPNHYWIELADGRALDPTADQFNVVKGTHFPDIYLGPPNKLIHGGSSTEKGM